MKIRHVACSVFVYAVSGEAHHKSRAEFDINAPFTVTGTVTRVEWTNPHTWFYVDVKDERGAVVNWAMEMGGPNALMRAGWKRTSINAEVHGQRDARLQRCHVVSTVGVEPARAWRRGGCRIPSRVYG